MAESDLDEFLAEVVQILGEHGVKFERGLNSGELAAAEEAVGCEFPPELSSFLRVALPIGDRWDRRNWRKVARGDWPQWRDDPKGTAERAKAWVLYAFDFDVRQNNYWLDDWGPRPENLRDAAQVAADIVASWPPLVRVIGHRFMPSSPAGPGNPVISVWQAGDSVYYGCDLADYFHRAFGGFGVQRPTWAAVKPRVVPFWTKAFDLTCDDDEPEHDRP